jgi:hypothetical protein
MLLMRFNWVGGGLVQRGIWSSGDRGESLEELGVGGQKKLKAERASLILRGLCRGRKRWCVESVRQWRS